ncbi:substrate-binding periplasmic protein [Oleidesulfovibrio sp.]|uniref:substrate-binding periplasmic protein n=1 Tax=Oleidesulfovibrio sp. TaxID=2909707 RepID=UPI003A8386F5
MNRTIVMAALLLTCLRLFCPQLAAAQAPQITLVTHELCPYSYYTVDGTFKGSAVRVVRYALDKMGFQLNLLVTPWSRAQQMVKNGHADGFFAASHNEERDKYATLSATIAEQRWNWYLRADSDLNPDCPTFRPTAHVAAFHGSNMLQWLNSQQFIVKGYPPNTQQLTQMLLAKRIDAMLASDQAMDEIIARNGLERLIRVHTAKDKPLGVYFSKYFLALNPDFLTIFNSHVRDYRETTPENSTRICRLKAYRATRQPSGSNLTDSSDAESGSIKKRPAGKPAGKNTGGYGPAPCNNYDAASADAKPALDNLQLKHP